MKPYKRIHPYRGKMYSITELARLSGVPGSTLLYRINQREMSLEEAIAEGRPGRNRRKLYDYRGEKLTASEISERAGIPVHLFNDRLHKGGWTVEEAAETPRNVPRNAWCIDEDVVRFDAPPGMPPLEAEKYGIAARLARLIVADRAFARFNFRCVTPMKEYAFDGDEITYRVRFTNDGNKAVLIAWFRAAGDDPPLSLHRCYNVSNGKIKEISIHA